MKNMFYVTTAPQFTYLTPGDQLSAAASYCSVGTLIGRTRVVPDTVWTDMDLTLYRRNRKCEVLQGHIIGTLHAFKDAGSRIGIFSTDPRRKIDAFLSRHEEIAPLFEVGGSFALIRGTEHLLRDGVNLQMPTHGITVWRVHFVFDRARGGMTSERIPKMIDRGELLIDDFDNMRIYDRIWGIGAGMVEGWADTPLAKAIAASREGFVHIRERAYAKNLTDVELDSIRKALIGFDVALQV